MTTKNQLEALMRLCIADTESERQAAKCQVQEMLKSLQAEKPEKVVQDLLFELGGPDHLLGYSYAKEALLLCLKDQFYINNITFGLYPQIAAKYDTTASRVERGIRHFIEVTWDRADTDVLYQFFGNAVRMGRGKLTNGEFLARMTNIARRKIDEVA